MAFALPIIAIAGAAVSAVGTILQGQAQKQALLYQQQVAQNNAIISAQQAQTASEATQAKVAKRSMEAAAQGGAILASEAAGGVDVNTGSNKAVRISQRELGQLDTETEMNKGQQTVYGYKAQATNYMAQAGLYGYEAPQAAAAADLGAIGQFTGSAAKWLSPIPTA